MGGNIYFIDAYAPILAWWHWKWLLVVSVVLSSSCVIGTLFDCVPMWFRTNIVSVSMPIFDATQRVHISKTKFFFSFILKTCYNHMENGSNWNHEWRRLAPFSYADCGHGRWWKLLCHVRDAICTPSLLCLILPIGVLYFYLLVSMTSFVLVCCCWCN